MLSTQITRGRGGLRAVLAAKRFGGERIILAGHHYTAIDQRRALKVLVKI